MARQDAELRSPARLRDRLAGEYSAAPLLRIVAVDEAGDPEPGEEPADVLSGGVYSSGDYLLCEIDWIDRPSPGEVTQLLEAAADAVDAAA